MHWRQDLLVAGVIINTAGLGVILWRLSRPPAPPLSLSLEAVRVSNAEILSKLDQLQKRMTRLPSSDTASPVLGALSDLLPDVPNSPVNTSISYIKVSENSSSPVEVYKEQADFSPLLGQLIPGQKYPFREKINSWYQVSLSGGQTGWVKADQVEEI